MRWRIVLLVAAMMAVLAVAGGVAVAAAIDGANGDDRVYAFNRPASKDVVNCGPGFDRVAADSRDVLDGCNRVSRL